MSQFDKKKKKYNREDISGEKELWLCQQLAQIKSPQEVQELYHHKFPERKPLSVQLIRYYKETRGPIIEEMRNKVLDKALKVPIANETVRLQRTEALYQVSTTILDKKDMVDTSLKCLKEARDEVKGEGSSSQTYLQFNQYNELSDEELLFKKKELENKIIELNKKGEKVYA